MKIYCRPRSTGHLKQFHWSIVSILNDFQVSPSDSLDWLVWISRYLKKQPVSALRSTERGFATIINLQPYTPHLSLGITTYSFRSHWNNKNSSLPPAHALPRLLLTCWILVCIGKSVSWKVEQCWSFHLRACWNIDCWISREEIDRLERNLD